MDTAFIKLGLGAGIADEFVAVIGDPLAAMRFQQFGEVAIKGILTSFRVEFNSMARIFGQLERAFDQGRHREGAKYAKVSFLCVLRVFAVKAFATWTFHRCRNSLLSVESIVAWSPAELVRGILKVDLLGSDPRTSLERILS